MFEVGRKGINSSNSGDINPVSWGFKTRTIKACKYVKIDYKAELGPRAKTNLNFDSSEHYSKSQFSPFSHTAPVST